MIGQLPPNSGHSPYPQCVLQTRGQRLEALAPEHHVSMAPADLQVRNAPAGRTLDGAIAETRCHRARFLAMTREDSPEIDMCTYLADFDGKLHDIRGRGGLTDVYDQASYAAGQTLARALKAVNCHGINQAVRRRSKKP